MRRVMERMNTLSRRSRVLLYCGAGLLVLYLLFGFFVAGPILRGVLEKQLAASLHRQVTVGEVSVNPITFGVAVRDLAVAQKEGEGTFIAFDALDVRLRALSLFKLAPVLGHLRLDRPRVDVTFLGQNTFSFSDLIPASNGTDSGSPDGEENMVFPFRVDNLAVTNGTVIFHDTPHKETHVISELDFSVPLASSLAENADDFVEPALRALVNGYEVVLAGKTKPFDTTLVTEFTFETKTFDIARYWEYVPVRTPLTLVSGSLSSKVTLAFSRPEEGEISMHLSGGATLENVAMDAPRQRDAVGFASLHVDVEDLDIFGGTLALREVLLNAPFVKVVRGEDGVINWQRYLLQPEQSAGGTTPANAGGKKSVVASSASNGTGSSAAARNATERAETASAAAPGFFVDAQRVELRDGVIRWTDNAVPGGFAKRIPVSVLLKDVSTRPGRTGAVNLTVGDTERIEVTGSAGVSPLKAELNVAVRDVSLPAYKAYLQSVQPLLVDSGTLQLGVRVLLGHTMQALQITQTVAPADNQVMNVTMAQQDTMEVEDVSAFSAAPPNVSVEALDILLNDLALRKDGNKTPSVRWESLHITGGSADMATRTASVQSVTLQAPHVRLIRYQDGLDLVTLLGGAASQSSEAPVRETAGDAEPAAEGTNGGSHGVQTAPVWQAVVHDIHVQNGSVRFVDRTLQSPARISLTGLDLRLSGASTDLSAPVQVAFSSAVGGGARSGNVQPGRLSVEGTVHPWPADIQVHVQHTDVPLALLDPYVGEYTGFLLSGGTFSTDMRKQVRIPASQNGTLEYAATGSMRINDFQLKDGRDADDVFGFSRLDVSAVDVSSTASHLFVDAVELTAPRGQGRVDADGVFNLTRLLHPAASAETTAVGGTDEEPSSTANATAPVGEANAVAPGPVATKHVPEVRVNDVPVAAAPPSVAVPAPDPATASGTAQYASVLPYKDVRINRVRVHDGEFRFADRSVTPPFATALTGVSVALDALSLAPDARPELNVAGKLDSHSLSLSGVLNPLITPMYSDVTFTLNGLELVPFTPYTLRSVAYPVHKGRLYADVGVQTQDWVLRAQNRFFIEQLQLGDKDKRPDAPSIPIKLGLALLSDSSGNIEIDLPIRGRLDDPQFLTGGIVFKAFVNLIFKVVTSPFALLGNIVGGGSDDAQFSVFEPGSARLSDEQITNLQTVVEFMRKKPSIKLEISGFVDEQADAKGLVELGLRRAVQRARYDDMSRRERAAVNVEDVQVPQEEYATYLEDAYKDVPKMENDPRPSGLFGFDDQPVAVMEAFLRAQTVVTPAMLDELATERAKAVQTKLLELDPSLAPRVFLVGTGSKPANRPGVARHRVELGVR